MKKLMFYCQYLTGMGHLVRSTEVIKELVKDFQVCLINGGPQIPGFQIPESVQILNLPPLWIEDGQLQVTEGFASLNEVKHARKNALIELCDRFQPDVLITEFFPFGRHKLLFELLPLLDHIQANYPATKIVSSVRDIIGRSDLEMEEVLICELAKKYFDLILCHSDSNFQLIEDCFSQVFDLGCEVKYTGFVAQSLPGNLHLNPVNLPFVLVSVGGGRIGYPLLENVILSAEGLANLVPHQIKIFTGPFLPESEFSQLQKLAEGKNNICLERYTPHLISYLKKADLSISLTGYNTTMNIMTTGVRALVVPIGHYNYDEEQLIRTKKLEQLGIVEVLEPQELNPDSLTQRICLCLQQPHHHQSQMSFNFNGAANSAKLIQQLLEPMAQLSLTR
jgi:predicted glycosyltransferase